jgi:hypothetical protein
MKNTNFFSLGWKDAIKGLIMAVGGAVFAVIESSVSTGNFHLDWPYIGKIAGAAAVVYLGKNLFTNSQDQFAKPEPKDKTN